MLVLAGCRHAVNLRVATLNLQPGLNVFLKTFLGFQALSDHYERALWEKTVQQRG